MIASLMMYGRPELEEAHGRYWALIRAALAARGVEAPEELSNAAEEFAVWEAPELVLSQTCGMPFRTRLRDRVQLVGTPDYGLDGCSPGFYRSAVVVRADDPREDFTAFRDARFAYNQTNSQSGFAAAYAMARSHGFWFQDRWQSGGHVKSAQAVAEGVADIAAIDAVTWRLIERYDGFARDLRVLAWTPPTPGLPYITAAGQDRGVVFDAVAQAISELAPSDRVALGIRGIIPIPAEQYFAVENPPADAA